MPENREILWVTLYGFEPGESGLTNQITKEVKKENAVRWLGETVRAMIMEEPVSNQGNNPFVGWRPIELVVTHEDGKKTDVDLRWERISRQVEGTPHDYTNAIIDPDTGKITGWKDADQH